MCVCVRVCVCLCVYVCLLNAENNNITISIHSKFGYYSLFLPYHPPHIVKFYLNPPTVWCTASILCRLGCRVWYDKNKMGNRTDNSMKTGISQSKVSLHQAKKNSIYDTFCSRFVYNMCLTFYIIIIITTIIIISIIIVSMISFYYKLISFLWWWWML